MYYRNIKTHQIKQLTISDINKRKKNTEESIKKKDKIILLTEGIGGLKKDKTMWKEDSTASKVCCYGGMFFCSLIFPCIIPCLCYSLYEDRKEKEKNNYPDFVPSVHCEIDNKKENKAILYSYAILK